MTRAQIRVSCLMLNILLLLTGWAKARRLTPLTANNLSRERGEARTRERGRVCEWKREMGWNKDRVAS